MTIKTRSRGLFMFLKTFLLSTLCQVLTRFHQDFRHQVLETYSNRSNPSVCQQSPPVCSLFATLSDENESFLKGGISEKQRFNKRQLLKVRQV